MKTRLSALTYYAFAGNLKKQKVARMPLTSHPEMERNTSCPCAEERRALAGSRREMGRRSAEGSRAAKSKSAPSRKSFPGYLNSGEPCFE